MLKHLLEQSVNVVALKRTKFSDNVAGDDVTERRSSSAWDNDDIRRHILSFVGRGSHRFIAGVSRNLRCTYTLLFPEKRTFYTVANKQCAKMCLQELRSESVKTHLCYLAAGEGKQDIVAFLHLSGCPWDEWCCAAAAREGHLDLLQ
jgi:hypothetical protein